MTLLRTNPFTRVNDAFKQVLAHALVPASWPMLALGWCWLALFAITVVSGLLGTAWTSAPPGNFTVASWHLALFTGPMMAAQGICFMVIVGTKHALVDYTKERDRLTQILEDKNLVRQGMVRQWANTAGQFFVLAILAFFGLCFADAFSFTSIGPTAAVMMTCLFSVFLAFTLSVWGFTVHVWPGVHNRIKAWQASPERDVVARFMALPASARNAFIAKAQKAGLDTESHGFMKAVLSSYEQDRLAALEAAKEIEAQTSACAPKPSARL